MAREASPLDALPTHELFERALDVDEDQAWAAIRALHWRGTAEVLEAALAFAGDADARRRAVAADVLGQLGVRAQPFRDQRWQALARLLGEDEDADVLKSAAHAFGHFDDPRAVPLLLARAEHPSVDVRFGVACALGSYTRETGVTAALVRLMRDEDDEVRDWATFGLGTLGEEDGDEVRDALLARVADPAPDVRAEAMAGLAKRGDRRLVRPLIEELRQDWRGGALDEAVAHFLGLTDTRTAEAMPSETIIARLEAL